jgi:hypothetical protein
MNLCVGHKLKASLSEAIVAQAVLDVKTFICFIINDLQKPLGFGAEGPLLRNCSEATVTSCNSNEAKASSSAKLAKLRLVLFGEKIFRDGPAR